MPKKEKKSLGKKHLHSAGEWSASVIVPLHNGERTIKKCLEGIFSQTVKPVEVIVVDDCSKDSSVAIAEKFPCKIKKLGKNSGPAVARNEGARMANGNLLVFVDSDAVLKPNAIEKMVRDYEECPEAACVCGTFSKFSGGAGWFDKFRNLQLYWWHNGKKIDKKFISIFIVTGGSMKREKFFEIGGFNAAYANADVEDYEMGHRILKKYKILLDKSIQFDHDHYKSPFWILSKKLFSRSRMWASLLVKRKSFEASYATPNRGLGAVFASLSLLFLFITPFSSLSIVAAAVFFLLFILTDFGFYGLLLEEGGIVFLLYSVCVYYFLNLVMALGVGAGIIGCAFAKKGKYSGRH